MAATPEDMPRNKVGMLIKYDVKKIHDPEGKHDDCDYFVLDPVHDDVSLAVLAAYAEATEDEFLAADLRSWLQEVRIKRVQRAVDTAELKTRLSEAQTERILEHLDPPHQPWDELASDHPDYKENQ